MKNIKSKVFLNKKKVRLDLFLSNVLFKKNGYYVNTNPIGKKNDFITAPEISQAFGEIIGLYLYYIWKTKINSSFDLIELGPGNGTLFVDIANTLKKYPDFINNANITLIEINKRLKKIQNKNIKNLNLKNISWEETLRYGSKKPLIIYSNEFFDCFPVRQFFFKEKWFEKYVNFDSKNMKFYLEDEFVKSSKLLSVLKQYKKEKLLEISFERNNYFEKICKRIKKSGGIFFTIDYGYFENIKNFTLQAIHNHKISNVLENIGEKDISSHVNFKNFIEIAKKYKLNIDENCTQREFLIKYGILERKKALAKKMDKVEIDIAINRLIDQKEMGSLFKCLVVSNL